MWKIINLKFAGRCNHCGNKLLKGTRAIWQGSGRVICLGCVDEESQGEESYTHATNYGRDGEKARVSEFTTSGGTFTKCNCEDFPCCGH